MVNILGKQKNECKKCICCQTKSVELIVSTRVMVMYCRSLTVIQVNLYWNHMYLGATCCFDLEVEGQDIQCGGLRQVR